MTAFSRERGGKERVLCAAAVHHHVLSRSFLEGLSLSLSPSLSLSLSLSVPQWVTCSPLLTTDEGGREGGREGSDWGRRARPCSARSAFCAGAEFMAQAGEARFQFGGGGRSDRTVENRLQGAWCVRAWGTPSGPGEAPETWFGSTLFGWMRSVRPRRVFSHLHLLARALAWGEERRGSISPQMS